MATRNRLHWKLDGQGEYARQVGWKYSRNQKLIQHKFRLGADLNSTRYAHDASRPRPVLRRVSAA